MLRMSDLTLKFKVDQPRITTVVASFFRTLTKITFLGIRKCSRKMANIQALSYLCIGIRIARISWNDHFNSSCFYSNHSQGNTTQSFITTNKYTVNPLRPNSDLSQTSHCNIKGLSVRVVMRIENMITQVKFY